MTEESNDGEVGAEGERRLPNEVQYLKFNVSAANALAKLMAAERGGEYRPLFDVVNDAINEAIEKRGGDGNFPDLPRDNFGE